MGHLLRDDSVLPPGSLRIQVGLYPPVIYIPPPGAAELSRALTEFETKWGSPQEFVRSGILRGFPDFLKSDVFSVGHSHALRFQ